MQPTLNAAGAEFAPTPKRCRVTHAWLTTPVALELTSEAIRRRIHPDQLTAQIIDRVIRGGLVDTILDDPRLA